jgi:hypothetical protein
MPASTKTPPIALSDSQMSALLAASYPLPPASRPAFLEACARELARLPVLGDGALHRVVMAVQRQYFDPPDLSHEHAPRWSSRRRIGVRAAMGWAADRENSIFLVVAAGIGHQVHLSRQGHRTQSEVRVSRDGPCRTTTMLPLVDCRRRCKG